MTSYSNSFAQPILGPSVSLRSSSDLKLIPRFDHDTLYLRVLDRRGGEVHTFDSSDLAISRGDDTAAIDRFERVTTLSPADLAINFVLDNSGSMRHSYDSLTKYLDRTLDSIGNGAEFSAITFDNEDRKPEYDGTNRQKLFLASSGFTTEYSQIKHFWHFYDTIRSKYTPLFDAMWKSFEHIADRRKAGDSLRTDVMIVVTDGDDNCSRMDVTDLRQYASLMHTAIYVVNYRSEPDSKVLWLVNHSGGRVFTAETLTELSQTLNGIRRSLTSGYKVVFHFPFQGAATHR